ncbi:pyridoxamine 5'-phosphate oxidase family protein [Meridianimarinicoccus sp. MJW13]|uniref:pyridoxamine 5'-phosphate oxidase family protein n=1 Tax=Meridianimarinicoccus sp. MJW13 TaxID=2720031 RepID=UPI001867651D|nr:pyridoxamine 5'-phosphate oxidase family protein [Fluviibacterium sp. MJW13]
MSDPWTDLDAYHQWVWQKLQDGPRRPDAPARLLALATASADGAAARMVVLRAVDASARMLEIHTDLRSAKVTEIRADPLATLLLWDPADQLQARLNCEITLATGAEVAPLWAAIPQQARRIYGGAAASGTPLTRPEPLQAPDGMAQFAVLRCRVTGIDALHLGRDLHARARWRHQDGWHGQWIAP